LASIFDRHPPTQHTAAKEAGRGKLGCIFSMDRLAQLAQTPLKLLVLTQPLRSISYESRFHEHSPRIAFRTQHDTPATSDRAKHF
jgi:hypothetical protein